MAMTSNRSADENVFREARAIARHCISDERRDLLRAHIDDCKAAYDVFIISPTRNGMVELVGLWTRMLRAMDLSIPLGPDATPSGRQPVPRERAVA
jgi:hypothetical protein